MLARVVAVADRGPMIPLSVFVTAKRSLLSSPCSWYGESGWQARRGMQEGVVTVAVVQPPVVSEVLLQYLLSLWGVLLHHFRL